MVGRSPMKLHQRRGASWWKLVLFVHFSASVLWHVLGGPAKDSANFIGGSARAELSDTTPAAASLPITIRESSRRSPQAGCPGIMAQLAITSPVTVGVPSPVVADGGPLGEGPLSVVLPVVGIIGIMYVLFFGVFLAPYSTGTVAQVSHILVSSEREAKELLDRVQGVDGAPSLQSFEALAREFSMCRSAAEGGDLGEVRRVDVLPPLAKVVFDTSMATGTVHGPVQTKLGYHLVWVRSRID